ncbi:MAG: porphobilinogen synthase [Candidatus Omnitrophica bacterium]|nr:porphobilinogen synthase [Candidatus Omnitrophota bacterium]
MGYPEYRPRRLRQNENFRKLICQKKLSIENFVMPFFVKEGKDIRLPISSMPGIFQLSLDNLIKEIKEIKDLGILAILLFGIPKRKDEFGSQAYAKDGIIQKTVSKIKEKFPDILVITDICLCEYTSYGHCGVVRKKAKFFEIDNDATLDLLAKIAISHVEKGADMVAPSAMMDGQVKAIRKALDRSGFINTPIMAYSAKFSSCFYGPFREAAESKPKFGDRKSYQMDIHNSEEALREIELDIQEGADIVMVKPALSYLDIIYKAKERFGIPLAAYNVSGEFSMVKASARFGWLDEEKTILEILTSIKRAGADIIISYHTKELAQWLKKGGEG